MKNFTTSLDLGSRETKYPLGNDMQNQENGKWVSLEIRHDVNKAQKYEYSFQHCGIVLCNIYGCSNVVIVANLLSSSDCIPQSNKIRNFRSCYFSNYLNECVCPVGSLWTDKKVSFLVGVCHFPVREDDDDGDSDDDDDDDDESLLANCSINNSRVTSEWLKKRNKRKSKSIKRSFDWDDKFPLSSMKFEEKL